MEVTQIIARVNGQPFKIESTPGFGRGSIRVTLREEEDERTYAYPGEMDTRRIANAIFLTIYGYKGTNGDITPLVNAINMIRNEA